MGEKSSECLDYKSLPWHSVGYKKSQEHPRFKRVNTDIPVNEHT